MATQQTTSGSKGAPSASSAKSSGGVLPIPAAALNKSSKNPSNPRTTPRAPAPRLKLILRRLPPGLTQDEFISALGEEWKVGEGKIDWLSYKDGKISKDPSKPSRPSRAYVRVKDQPIINLLSEKIKQTAFQDAKNSTNDPCLIGPPSLEFAPYNRVPAGRARKDGRQGTIDQDPEFIEFLQGLTEPVTKPALNDENTDEAKVEITMTPLVQYIKEKKANKAKEKADKAAEKAAEKAAKAQKEKDAKETKNKETKKEKAESKKVSLMKKEKEDSKSPGKQVQLQKATKDAVKAANKQAAAIKAKEPAPKSTESPATKDPANPPPPKRERERGSAKAAIQTLQRDLAQANSPRPDRRSKTTKARASQDSSKVKDEASVRQDVTATISQSSSTKPLSRVASPAPKTPAPNGQKITKAAAPASQQQSTKSATPKAPSTPSPGAKSAFLKHANPSQGITEAALQEAFSAFGTVTKCEIDKRKGFGYVDFTDHEALKAAMAASPVKVGDKGGSVVVLERRSPPSTSNTKTAATSSSKPSAGSKATNPTQTTTSIVPAETSASTPAPTSESSATIVTSTTASPVPPTPKAGPTNSRGGQGRGSGRGGAGGRGRGGSKGPGGGQGRNGGGANAGNEGGSAASQSTNTASNGGDAAVKH